jgi:hypothetical protein
VIQAVVCTALRIEARAVRRGWPGASVTLVGLRGKRVDRLPAGRSPVVLLGFAGGLEPRQRAGDVVVATRIVGTDSVIELPAAQGILSEFRRAGIAASAGPILCSDHIVRGRERARLIGTAQAVDMESAAVALAVGPERVSVVRVVVDTPSRGLLRASLFSGRRSWRALRNVAATLAATYEQLSEPVDHQELSSGTVENAVLEKSRTGATNTAGTTEEG